MAKTTLYDTGPAQRQGNAPADNGWSGSGILAKWVMQSVNYGQSDDGGNTVKIRLKGPYKTGRDLNQNKLSCGMSLQEVFAANVVDVDTSVSPLQPQNPTGSTVALRSWEVSQDEVTAGQHCILTLDFDDKTTQGGSGEEGLLPNSDVWQLTWQPMSLDVYDFCTNTEAALSSAKAAGSSGSGDDDTTGLAASPHINQYLEQAADNAINQNSFNYQATLNGKQFTLNHAERLIARKKMSKRQPTYHFPILRHSQTKVVNKGSIAWSGVGGDIDCTVSIPQQGIPMTLETPHNMAGWEWLCVGDQVNCTVDGTTGRITATRTLEYWGTPYATQSSEDGWDVNFYGTVAFNHTNLEKCRWRLGAL